MTNRSQKRCETCKRTLSPGAYQFYLKNGKQCTHGGQDESKKKTQPMPITGLGDVVAKITSAFGIKPCGGCQKRKEKLNQLFPLNQPKEK